MSSVFVLCFFYRFIIDLAWGIVIWTFYGGEMEQGPRSKEPRSQLLPNSRCGYKPRMARMKGNPLRLLLSISHYGL